MLSHRNTSRAISAVNLAAHICREHRQSKVLPVHLLLAFLGVSCTAGQALGLAGITKSMIESQLESGRHEPTDHIMHSDELKTTLEKAHWVAVSCEATYVGTEHVLLAMIEQGVFEGLLRRPDGARVYPATVKATIMGCINNQNRGGELAMSKTAEADFVDSQMFIPGTNLTTGQIMEMLSMPLIASGARPLLGQQLVEHKPKLALVADGLIDKYLKALAVSDNGRLVLRVCIREVETLHIICGLLAGAGAFRHANPALVEAIESFLKFCHEERIRRLQ